MWCQLWSRHKRLSTSVYDDLSQILLFVFGEAGNGTGTSPAKSDKQEPQTKRSPSSTPPAAKNIDDLRHNPGYTNVDIFTYEEMKLATKHFRPDFILGEGGFGVVYKGMLDESVRPGYKTMQVAIKELNRDGFQGDKEWLVHFSFFFVCF